VVVRRRKGVLCFGQKTDPPKSHPAFQATKNLRYHPHFRYRIWGYEWTNPPGGNFENAVPEGRFVFDSSVLARSSYGMYLLIASARESVE